MNDDPLHDLKNLVANAPLDSAMKSIVYALKDPMTYMGSMLILIEAERPGQKEDINTIKQQINKMLGVIDELIIGILLPRLQSSGQKTELSDGTEVTPVETRGRHTA